MTPWQRIVKVQLHIPQIFSRSGRPLGVFAHNFVVIVDAGGRPIIEFNGLAHSGTKIDGAGGVLPFDQLKGRIFRPSYFYDPGFPQVEVFRAGEAEVSRRRRAGEAVNEVVNSRHMPYPWLAATGLNSNSYCSTLLRVMELPDPAVPHGWPSPQSGRYLLSSGEMAAISGRYLASGMAGVPV